MGAVKKFKPTSMLYSRATLRQGGRCAALCGQGCKKRARCSPYLRKSSGAIAWKWLREQKET
jgi:hypothetical protein